jgi:DNA helicase-2/ATP-dependent DNA helicase PcrA
MLSDLNPPQLQAVEQTDGPVLILAGAGSGKTRALTYRVAYLIQQKKIKPWNILAVTFTNKAAAEMKHRIEKLLGTNQSTSMWISTFHSTCLRILRKNASCLGYEGEFSVYDDRDQQNVLKQCIEELKLNPRDYPPKKLAYRINQAKNEGISASSYQPRGYHEVEQVMAEVYPVYQKKLLQNQAMDFGDLILNTVLLFKNHPEVLEHYQNKFQYIHVDEYQDTNRCQYLLISMLAAGHQNLCVVGDDDQSIYRFRGAEIRNILDFREDYPHAFVIRLEQNYRSTQTIIQAASQVIDSNTGRMGKNLWTENQQGEKITLFCGEDEKDEADFVVKKIQALKGKKAYKDMAIFYRTNAQSRAFEDVLRRENIPYMIFGGMKFYERQEIKDMMAYLKVIINPSDTVSLKRIINVPARGIGKTTSEKIEGMASLRNLSFWEMLEIFINDPTTKMTARLKQGLGQFYQLITELSRLQGSMHLVDLVKHLYDQSGYIEMLESQQTIEAESRIENLDEFINVIVDYVKQVENPSLKEFLDRSSLATDLDSYDENNDYLPLMTLHLAKGLEFPVVFMVGLEEGLFPHSRSLHYDEEVEEERRLCYVGMTRAEQKLYMSYVQDRQVFGSSQSNPPSRFIEEIPQKYIDSLVPSPKSKWECDDFEDDSVHVEYDFDQRPDYERKKPYNRGQHVIHPVFGSGIIRAVVGNPGEEKLTIAFGAQQKKIMAKYVDLKVL